MKQNIFQVNGSLYEQLERTAIGNSMSSFLAKLFTSLFENDLESTGEYFPIVWLSYMDEIFAIFDSKKCNIDYFLNRSNLYKKKRETISYPSSILVIRNRHRLELNGYRKGTHASVNSF